MARKHYLFFAFVIFSLMLIPLFAHAQDMEPLDKFLYHELFYDVDKNGDYVYCSGHVGISALVLDSSGAFVMENLMQTIDNREIYIKNHHAFITGSQFRVFDLTEPLEPELIYEYDWDYSGGVLKADDGLAYIETWAWVNYSCFYGIDIFSIENPSYPHRVDHIYHDGTRNISGYDVEGEYLCISWYDWDLPGSDILILYRNLDEADSISSYGDYHGIYDVAIFDAYAYVITGLGTLIIDLDQWAIVDTLEDIHANRIQAEGDQAFLIYGDGFSILDVMDPLNPHLENTYIDSLRTINIFEKDDTLYRIISDDGSQEHWYHGIKAMDLSDPSNPIVLAQYNTADLIRGIQISGDYAYIPNFADGLRIYEISNPQNPQFISLAPTSGRAENAKINGQYAYVAAWDAGFQIIDISDHHDPVEINSIDSIGTINNIVVNDSIVYALSRAEIYIFNVADPVNIVPLGIYGEFYSASYASLYDNLLYINDSYDSLVILDVSSPESPQYLGAYQYQSRNYHGGFDVQGNYAYLSNSSRSIQIIEISDPSAPQLVSEFPGLGNGLCATAHELYVFLSASRGQPTSSHVFSVLDVSDAANPVFVDSLIYELDDNRLDRKVAFKDDLIFLPTYLYIDILRFTPTGIEQVAQIPTSLFLSPNYPNPFNASTTISYTIPKASDVTLDIYNILGRKVRTIFDGAQNPGEHSVVFNADGFSSGVYFYKLTAGSYSESMKMSLIK